MKTKTVDGTKGEGRKHWLCAAVVPALYSATTSLVVRSWLRRLTLRLEGGAMYSLTVREVYRKCHDLDVGLYTIGPCESGPHNFAPGTSIGRYSSIYYTVRTIGPDELWQTPGHPPMNHGDALASTAEPQSSRARLVIGNDVFIGHNAIILPIVGQIGDGAFIGAGSVVQKPVPPYAVVMGNPARVVKYRFSEKTIAELLESRWWDKGLDELVPEWKTFEVALETGEPNRA
jgi:acetyltransferase-like isoleucine patch superfamily enzyme